MTDRDSNLRIATQVFGLVEAANSTPERPRLQHPTDPDRTVDVPDYLTSPVNLIEKLRPYVSPRRDGAGWHVSTHSVPNARGSRSVTGETLNEAVWRFAAGESD